jgi:hypothetical protein
MVAHDSVGGSSSKQGGCIPGSRFADGSSFFSLCFSFVLFIFFLLSISLSSFHFCSSLFVPFFFLFFFFLSVPLFSLVLLSFFFRFFFHSFLSSFFVLPFYFMFFTSSPPFFSLFLLPVLPCIYMGQEKRDTLPYLITSNEYGGWTATRLPPVGLVPPVFSSW